MKPYYQDDNCEIYHGDCVQVMAQMRGEYDMILTDPPYFKVKNEPWDRQWADAGTFLQWLGSCADEWRRLLKANGSLYCFASAQMSARVEVTLAERFNILNHIVWAKNHTVGGSIARRVSVPSLRSWMPEQERVIFCEQHGADNSAKGEAGYVAKCDELRGFVFEPLRAYLAGERDAAGIKDKEARAKMGLSVKGGGLLCHFWNAAQWMLPTQDQYNKLRKAYPGHFLREYEDLRREYEDLRRPFSVTADMSYTDVWTFEPVRNYKGKHPCEKPHDMLTHMITASSKPGAWVLDCFMGSGSTIAAAIAAGRKAIGIDACERYCETVATRLEQGSLF